jgi:hypothetical protein
MTRGQDGSLCLSCVTLSFTTPRRFYPGARHGLLGVRYPQSDSSARRPRAKNGRSIWQPGRRRGPSDRDPALRCRGRPHGCDVGDLAQHHGRPQMTAIFTLREGVIQLDHPAVALAAFLILVAVIASVLWPLARARFPKPQPPPADLFRPEWRSKTIDPNPRPRRNRWVDLGPGSRDHGPRPAMVRAFLLCAPPPAGKRECAAKLRSWPKRNSPSSWFARSG